MRASTLAVKVNFKARHGKMSKVRSFFLSLARWPVAHRWSEEGSNTCAQCTQRWVHYDGFSAVTTHERRCALAHVMIDVYGLLLLLLFFLFFFLFTRSRLQSHEGEFWSMLLVGLPTLSRPVVSASLHRQCTKRNRRSTEKGRGETKETKERRRTEEVGGLEIYGSAESVKNGLS